MNRKIVISVLVVSSVGITWAGISGLADWGSRGFGFPMRAGHVTARESLRKPYRGLKSPIGSASTYRRLIL